MERFVTETGPARPATQDWLDELRAEGVLTTAQWRVAGERLRASVPWRQTADRLLGVTGASLVLTGIVYFFAYNWRAMPPLAKFAVIDLAIVLAVVVALRRGLDDLIARLCALSAAVLVGVFLGVLGQVYQSGASAWLLFAAWAALITPWAVLVRFAPLWALWLGVADLALVLYMSDRWPALPHSAPFLVLGAWHAFALLVRERAAANDRAMAGETWLRQAILAVLLGALMVPALVFVAPERTVYVWDDLGFLAWVAACGLAWWWFLGRSPDLFSLCQVALSVCFVLLYTIGFHILPKSDFGMLFVFALIVVATFSGAAFVLRGAMRTMLARGGSVE